MIMSLNTEKTSLVLLVLLLILAGVYGVMNHSARIELDDNTHIRFARDLAKGNFFNRSPILELFDKRYPTDKPIYVRHKGYRMKDGKIFAKYEIGGPFLLSIAARLFGDDAMFFVNPFLMLVLLLFIFLLSREVFYREEHRNSIALISAMLILLLKTGALNASLNTMRDFPSLTFLVAGAYFIVRSMREKSKVHYAYFALGVFVYGLSCTIRLTNIVMLVPYGLYITITAWKRVRFKGFLGLIGLAAVCFAIALTPIFIQNHLTSGNILVPPQSPEAKGVMPFLPEDREGIGLDLFNLYRNILPASKWIVSMYTPVFLVFILIGIVLSWRRIEVKTLLVITPILFFILFSTWSAGPAPRYFISIHPFLVTLLAYGIVRIATFHWRRLERLIKPLAAPAIRITPIVGLIFILTALNLSEDTKAKHKSYFGIKEAKLFKANIEELVPEGAMVFSAKYLKQVIDIHTHACSMTPDELRDPWKLSPRESIDVLIDGNVPVYLFDNEGMHLDMRSWIGEIRDHFDFIPVAKVQAGDLHATFNMSKRKSLNLYKIERWKSKEITLTLDITEKADHLLTIDAQKIWNNDRPKGDVSILLNGGTISTELVNDINFYVLPEEFLKLPASELKILADSPLPSDVLIGLQPLGSDYLVEYEGKDNTLKIPTFIEPDSQLILRFSAKLILPAYEVLSRRKIHLLLNGTRFQTLEVARPNSWESYFVILPPELIGSGDSTLSTEIDPQDNGEMRASWPGRTPAVKLDTVKVEQWSKDKALAVQRPTRFAVLGIMAKGVPEKHIEGRTITINLNGHELETRLETGTNRVIVPPDLLRKSGQNIHIAIKDDAEENLLFKLVPALSADESYVGSKDDLFVFIQYVPISEKHVINVGDEDDLFIIDGFHQKEIFCDITPFRWTGADAGFFVPYDDKSRDLVLEISVLPSSEHVGRVNGLVFMNQEKLGGISITPNSARTYRFDVPSEILEIGANELRFVTPTWRPCDYFRTTDKRELGIMLNSITLHYIDRSDEGNHRFNHDRE